MSQLEKIKLYTFYNSHFNVLKDRFLRTIKDDYDVQCILCDFAANKEPISQAKEMFISRGTIICNAIRDNFGKIIIVSDIDIQFFRPTEPVVRDMLQSYDMVFQRGEDFALRSKNMGFIGINCHAKTLAFWEQVLQIIKDTGRWEEIIVNELLATTTDVTYGVFPDTIWTPMLHSRPTDIILHHAIVAGITPQRKLKQMEQVTKALERGTFTEFKIKTVGDTLLSQLHTVNRKRTEVGNLQALGVLLPRVLYNHFIDKNIGRVGLFIKKLSPTLYAKLKSTPTK